MSTSHQDLKREMPSKCKTEWDEDPEIRKEFGTLDSYTAFRIAEEAGATSVTRGPVITPLRDKGITPLVPDPKRPKKKE